MLKINHTICPSCSVGCGLNLIIKNQEAVGTYPYKRHPINEGKNCKKGRDSFLILNENRLMNPLMKNSGLEQVRWEDALDTAAQQLKSYSNDEIGIIASGNCTNQEYKTLKKFADSLSVENIGYNTGKTPYFNIKPTTLDEVENSDIILIMGDVLKENPLLGRRIILVKENGAEIITLDTPENTLTGINSHEYIQIDSTSSVLDRLDNSKVLYKLTRSSAVIIGKMKINDDFSDLLTFFQQSDAKILPVLEDCNTKGAMNILPALREDDLKEIMEKVKILYVLGDDPAIYIGESMQNIDFVISQGCFVNETVLMSDLVLPGSCWAEKSGSFTNTTGETQEFKQIIPAPGNAMDDQTIILKIAEKMGLEL